jgi:putative membrane protein
LNWLSYLPTVNASLNALSGICLLAGFLFIRRRNIKVHKRFMLAACACSLLFLVTYLTYHANAGTTRFRGTGWTRPLYFTILTTHTILAATVVPLAIISVVNGLKMRVEYHKRIVRWTFPIWMYVSVTGVLVYLFLYHFFPSG